METVKEFYGMKSAFVDVEMDVPLLEVRCAGFPDNRFRIQALHFLPGGKADPPAVRLGQSEQKVEVIIPSDLAYGPEGREPTIGSNETLVFEMETVGKQETPKAK